jgi:large subunit ribosomal protein L5
MADEEKSEEKAKKKREKSANAEGEKLSGAGRPDKPVGGRKARAQASAAAAQVAAAAEESASVPEPPLPARLRLRFEQEIVPALMRDLKITNRMRVPTLGKIVINMALSEARENVKILDSAADELQQIAGQKTVTTRARKAISNFKLREGMPIGVMVTLRRDRMWEFFDRLVNIALPRVRDFRGVSDKAFDGRGNYSLGLREHTIFPELNLDKIEKVKGMTISITTSAASDFEGTALLKALGMPFRGAADRDGVAVRAA